jgi:hypothetical protein
VSGEELDECRGEDLGAYVMCLKGLSKWMMQVLFSHPELQGFRRWMLATRDAHGRYRQGGRW